MDQASQNLLAEQSVLVVDDNAINREFLRTVLDEHVAEIRVAQDGPAALEMVRDWQPGLVLMDLHMPGMDGLETWQRMARELEPKPRSVVLTADWRPEERRRLLGAGFDAFLGKPVDSGTLLDCLHKVVAQRDDAMDAVYVQSMGRSDASLPLLDDDRALAAANQSGALVAQMRKLLLDELEVTGRNLDRFVMDDEPEKLKAAIHQLKGSCGYAGASRLQNACHDLERALEGVHAGASWLQLARTLELTRLALRRAVANEGQGAIQPCNFPEQA